MSQLNNGDTLPSLTAPSVNHGEYSIPGDLSEEWSAVLFYRGEW